VLLVGLGVLLLYTRWAKGGRAWLTLVLAGYWASATPFGSTLLARPVAAFDRVETRADAHGATAVVLLGGGILTHQADGLAIDDLLSSAPRVLEAVRVYRLLDRPLVFVSGGNTSGVTPPHSEARAFRRALLELGVPDDRIIVEETSQTTRDEVVLLKPLLVSRHVERFILVTSPIHMRRALAAFRAGGLAPIPSAAALRTGVARSIWSPIPDRDSLLLSDAVVYEALATAWYRSRGWLEAASHGS